MNLSTSSTCTCVNYAGDEMALEKNFIRILKMSNHRVSVFVKRFAFLALLCTINVLVIRRGECFSPLWDSVKTQVYQEYEILSTRGQISVVRTRLNTISKSDLIVGENVKQNSRLILTCTAWYPSEWVYSGDAVIICTSLK